MSILFSRKPAYTLLLVTRSMVARIDFIGRGKPKVSQIWSEQPFHFESFQGAVAHAIQLGPKTLGRLSIASPEFWTDIIQLSTDVVAIATPQETRHALAMEAEVESGIPAFDSRVACQRLLCEDQPRIPFCSTQVENSLVADLVKLAPKYKTRLHSLTHPIAFAGIDSSVSLSLTSDALAWWNDPQSDFSQKLEDFSSEACKVFGRRTDLTPMLIVPSKDRSRAKQIALCVSVSALTVGGCAAWNLHSRQQLEATLTTIDQLEKQQQVSTISAAAIKRAETKLVNLRKETQEADDWRASIEGQLNLASEIQQRQNARWSRLIDSLAQEAKDCWVQRIESNVNFTTVHGVAISNAEAHAFAARLEQALSADGWLLSPATTSLLEGGLFQFSISLKQTNAPQQTDRSNEIVIWRTNDAVVRSENLSIVERLP